jgi:hypothetical protein
MEQARDRPRLLNVRRKRRPRAAPGADESANPIDRRRLEQLSIIPRIGAESTLESCSRRKR